MEEQNGGLSLLADTSGKTASLALLEGEHCLLDLTMQLGLTHSERFFEGIDLLFRLANRELKQLKALAVVVGPGSFTGLRIGLTACKVLASQLQIPLYPLSSLQLMVDQWPDQEESLLVPALDARNRRLYVAVHHRHEERLSSESVCTIPEVVEFLLALQQSRVEGRGQLPKKLVLLGEAWHQLRPEEEAALKAHYALQIQADWPLRVEAGKRSLWRLQREGKAPSEKEVLPNYLLASNAERAKQEMASLDRGQTFYVQTEEKLERYLNLQLNYDEQV